MTQTIIGNSVLDKYFDETTMSLHLKANRPILRKKGFPGNWQPVVDPNEIMTKEAFNELIDQLFKEVETREDAFLEINRELSKVLQIWPYRIVIVYPALSDGLELTAVKPVKKMSIEEYNLQPELFELLRNKSKGILVSGAPGSGKSTFTGALIELYHKDQHIIKTIESPRDLMLNDDIVQYSFTYGSHDEVRDILLLSRPDYTIYDEVRNKPDFELYKDLRLTGIGLVGVIHATKPVDSIQRFIGSIEMGIIPQVVDTVIFIDKGQVSEVPRTYCKSPRWNAFRRACETCHCRFEFPSEKATLWNLYLWRASRRDANRYRWKWQSKSTNQNPGCLSVCKRGNSEKITAVASLWFPYYYQRKRAWALYSWILQRENHRKRLNRNHEPWKRYRTQNPCQNFQRITFAWGEGRYCRRW